DVLRPLVRGERALRGECGQRRVLRPAEGDEERVALCADPFAARLLEGRAQESVVIPEDVAPAVAEGPGEVRRALDVADQEGEGAARRRRHRSTKISTPGARAKGQATGSVAWSRKPPSGRGPAWSSPP